MPGPGPLERPTARQERVLSIVVTEHIRTGEPVGSVTARERLGVEASSATIRNDMAALTDMGLLRQPHTSAGRVPTDRGYRYFIEHVMDEEPLGLRETAWVRSQFRRRTAEAADVLREGARLLATLLHCPAVIVSPRQGRRALDHFHASPVSSRNVLLVVATADGHVENRLVELPAPITSRQLERITEVLNRRFAGAEVGALSRMDIRELYAQIGEPSLPPAVLEAIREGLAREVDQDVYIDGVIYVLQDPHMRQAEELQGIVETLYQQPLLRAVLASVEAGEVCVRVGSENRIPEAYGCSIVARGYVHAGGGRGVVAALGPKRLPYWRAIPAVTCVADELTEHLGAETPGA
jgi:heat-inducible transcriptional repressor